MENKFIIEQKSLLTILSSMQPICNKRTALNATSSILFQIGHKELVLKGTDLEISLQASCPVKGSYIDENMFFLVPGKQVFDLTRELDGDIEFSYENNQLLIKAGQVFLALKTKDVQEFPPFPERIENLMSLDSALLQEMLDKVAFLIPQNNSNPALNGLYLEISNSNMKMTTTDGHCLAQLVSTKYFLEEPRKWLLPRRSVFELKKILETVEDANVFLGTCGNQLVFSGESFNFFTKLLADSFPQYEPILQKDKFLAASIDRGVFLKTLKRSTCFLSGQFIATQFEFSPKLLNVTIQNKEVGKLEEAVPLKVFDGDKLDVKFFAPYLLEGVQAFVGDEVKFYLKSATTPIIFEGEHGEFHLTYLVMPISSNQ